MNTRTRFGLAGALVVGSALAGVLAAPSLPEQVVVRWNAAGEPAGRMAKTTALVVFPALSAGLLGLLAVLPRVDPLGENVAAFRRQYDRFAVLLVAYLSAVWGGVLAYNLGHEFDFVALVVAGGAGLFWFLGDLLPAAERNWFVGIRTPWTLSSDAVWERTHAVGGRLFKLTAVVALAGLALPVPVPAVYLLAGPATVVALATTAYSFVLYRRLEDDAGSAPG